jgi:hypothetical protein
MRNTKKNEQYVFKAIKDEIGLFFNKVIGFE